MDLAAASAHGRRIRRASWVLLPVLAFFGASWVLPPVTLAFIGGHSAPSPFTGLGELHPGLADCRQRTAQFVRKAVESGRAAKPKTAAEEASLEQHTVLELREKLRKFQLPVSGRKQELIQRLKEAQALQDEAERSAQPAQPYHEMKVVDLKEALRALGMPVSGRKPDLVARLEAAGKEETSPAHFSEKSSDTDDVDVLEPGQVSLSNLRVGQKLRGIVRRISQWGAFVEIGAGATALARISRMAERYVEDVYDVVPVGQEVVVWVYRIAPDGKIGLSMIEYPPSKLKDPVSFFEDARPSEWFTATVRFISHWSIFVDVAVPEGGGLVQGILHQSQFPYPEKAVKGQEVEVRVVEIISNTGTLRLTAMKRGSR